MSRYPLIRRPRRLRRSSALRDLVRETRLSREDLVYPLFVKEGASEGANGRKEVPAMPGVHTLSLDALAAEIDDLSERGVKSLLLFGVPESKDARGSGAYRAGGLIPQAITAIKARNPSLVVIADVCLCAYTDHGHCGVVVGDAQDVDNDATLPLLADTAIAYAQAGADIVAPSDMMDGRVGCIRERLDKGGFAHTPIMSYAVKQASSLYGPFRDAARCAPQAGDRKGYQMDAGNAREAVLEATLDIEEGADILMVKPALSNLDLISALYRRFSSPIAAYQVSGEYAMIKAAAAKGWLEERDVVLETLTAIKRAGAKIIVSYFAKEAVTWV